MFFEVQFLIITHCIDRVIDPELAYPTYQFCFLRYIFPIGLQGLKNPKKKNKALKPKNRKRKSLTASYR